MEIRGYFEGELAAEEVNVHQGGTSRDLEERPG